MSVCLLCSRDILHLTVTGISDALQVNADSLVADDDDEETEGKGKAKASLSLQLTQMGTVEVSRYEASIKVKTIVKGEFGGR
jgi:hypothetical protein